MTKALLCAASLAAVLGAGSGAALAQAGAAAQPQASDVESLLDAEARRQHQRRIDAYARLKVKLDSSVAASAEARNLAVGSALQMVTPLTDIKVQQLQNRTMQQGYR
jgi:hypothetical protein